jgi:cell division protein FtsB
VLERIKNTSLYSWAAKLGDNRNLVLVGFLLIVYAMTWSGVKTAQRNYELQKQISVIQQQNSVLKLSNQNTALQKQYYNTDQYLELAARQNFGLAAPGETVLLVPNNVAMKYVNPKLSPPQDSQAPSKPKSKVSQNFQDWRDFLLGRRMFAD